MICSFASFTLKGLDSAPPQTGPCYLVELEIDAWVSDS
jgi:hypothetical protein